MPAIIKVVDGRTIISVNGAQAAYLAAQAGIQKAVDDLGGTFKGDKGDTGPANNTYTDLAAFKAQPVTNANATLITAIGGVNYSWLVGDYSAVTPDDDVYIKADDEALSVGVWKKEAALASTDPGAGAALVAFAPKSLTKSLRSVQDKLQEVLTLPDYGGIGDGSAHTVQEWITPGSHGRYADLTALQVDYPH